MQTRTFEATAELVAQVKEGVSASDVRTIVSEEGNVTYLRKAITFFLTEVEGGIELSSSAAGTGDFLFEANWVEGVLNGKDPNEQPTSAPKTESVPVPATIIALPQGPSTAKPNPTTFTVPASAVIEAIKNCETRTLGATEEGVTTYVSKTQFTITETAEGFILASAAAGPGDFYAELNWINSVLPQEAAEEKPAEAPAKQEEAKAPEKAAEKPAPAKPAAPCAANPVAVAPSAPVKEIALTTVLAVAGAALVSLAVIKKMFKK
ncbi:MAG: hypothetical protein ACI4BI_04370 [Anaerotardibacter sp.]